MFVLVKKLFFVYSKEKHVRVVYELRVYACKESIIVKFTIIDVFLHLM